MALHEQLTVVVARNGYGKTAVLDAITVALGTFVGAFELGKDKKFLASDAHYQHLNKFGHPEQQYPVTLTAHLTAPSLSDLTVQRQLTGAKNRTTIKGAQVLTDYAKDLQKKVRNIPETLLPIVVYYGTDRLWQPHRNTTRESLLSASRTLGYEDCLVVATNFKQVQQWFKKATLAVIQQQEKPEEYSHHPLPQQVAGIQDAVNQILAVAGWSDFHYSFSYEELVMFHPQQGILPVSLLSDGVRSMVSLAVDLAWRCAKLNPHLAAEAFKQTPGIVLIDEVDMHLHPSWQQLIIQQLQNTFPTIQFIVSTHSPQVLTTVAAESIRIIDESLDKDQMYDPLRVYAAPKGTKGAEASRVLKRVLGVEVRPPADVNTQLLNQYLDLVYADKWAEPKAQQLRQQLNGIYWDEEPALTEADLYIENKQWELSLEKD